MWQVGGTAWPRFIILWHLYLHTVAVIHSRLLTARHTNNNTIQGPSSFMCRWGVMHWFRSGVPTSPTDQAPPHSHLLITETCCWLLCHFFQMMFSWFKNLTIIKFPHQWIVVRHSHTALLLWSHILKLKCNKVAFNSLLKLNLLIKTLNFDYNSFSCLTAF